MILLLAAACSGAASGPPDELEVSIETRFAASGDPNGPGAPTWPRYETASDLDLALDLAPAAGTAFKKDACDFWDTLAVP